MLRCETGRRSGNFQAAAVYRALGSAGGIDLFLVRSAGVAVANGQQGPVETPWTDRLSRAVARMAMAVRKRRRWLGDFARPNLWSPEPVSRQFGFDRGMPIDRHYIEQFLARESDRIRGRVLEVEHDLYTRKYGGDRVTRSDVLYKVPGLAAATIVADLANAPQLASDAFDCIILIHTLQYIFDAAAALETCRRLLAPGGHLLIAVPFISQYCVGDREKWGEYWRFSAMAMNRMLGRIFGSSAIRVEAHGNALTAACFLKGIAAEELSASELGERDPDYDLVITAVARKD